MATVKDFTPDNTVISFSLYGGIFTVPADIPVVSLAEFLSLQDKVSEIPSLEDLKQMFRLLLHASCADDFIALFTDKVNPLGIKTVTDILNWILSELGMDPTVPNESSLPGQANPESGMSSTVNVSGEVLSLPSS
jgi:hypothetical protein